MKTHYLEHEEPVCGTKKPKHTVATKSEWYSLPAEERCFKCEHHLSHESGVSQFSNKVFGQH